MRKKNEWERRKTYSASIGLKKTVGLSIEDEIDHFRKILGLGGLTELYKKFLLERLNLKESEFDNWIINLIHKEAKIEKGRNSEEFRKFLAMLILENSQKKEQKTRWENYVKSKEYL